jgi:ethanolamine permease
MTMSQPAGEATLRAGQLGVRDVWALGVGIVVCGQYFGWNLGLAGNGPVAMLIASLAVCLLFFAWVLTLSELAVAMPSAAGPLVYGRRAGGPWLGFLMGWSMFLECLFGGVATALASGNYVAFLVNPQHPSPTLAVLVGLATVVVFFFLQVWGVKEQARALLWMTYAAIAGLVIFWVCAGAHFSWERVWTAPVIPAEKGWQAVLDAIPFALWWLIIIEGAALAGEEARRPERTVPRGLTWGMVTVIALVILTTTTACGAVPFQKIAVKEDGQHVIYPLAEVIRRVPAGGSPLVLYGFGSVAIFGLIASYHGLLYGASRQAFGLGREGYLPTLLGRIHPRRQTPWVAVLACSLVSGVMVLANFWFEDAVAVAVLVAGFAALVLYLLSMAALALLRRREPGLFTRYQAPLGWALPACVVLLTLLALLVYPRLDAKVVPVALGMYALGAGYFFLRGRQQVVPGIGVVVHSEASPAGKPLPVLVRGGALAILALVGAALLWMTLAAYGLWPSASEPSSGQAVVLLAGLTASLGGLTVVGLCVTR